MIGFATGISFLLAGCFLCFSVIVVAFSGAAKNYHLHEIIFLSAMFVTSGLFTIAGMIGYHVGVTK